MKILFTKNNQDKFWTMLPWVLLVLCLLIIIGLSIKINSITKNPSQVAQNEINTIVNKVGKLMILPKDELPTIATITDINALKQAYKGDLFDNAEVGDKILIFVKSSVAVIYDPIANKIVESGPISNISSTSTIKK